LNTFTTEVEAELGGKIKKLRETHPEADLDLDVISIMKRHLRKRQIEDAGVTGFSIWAESHAAIHTWDDENYFAFDAFSCKEFDPGDALRLLLNTFDIEGLNCYNILRFQRSPAIVTYFSVDSEWRIFRDGKLLGELDDIDFQSWEKGRTPSHTERGIQ
jgi:S-adenosylmethionine/arginine decarboxylase-like enzyme